MPWPKGKQVKVGVTGGAGFIGSWVVDELIARGHTPVVFDPRGRVPRSDVEVMLGDVRDEVAVTELAAHVDGVIHLAAVLGTQETIKNPRPAFLTNGVGGLNVLEAVTQYDLPLVNICVGNFWMNNSYSITKSTFERTLQMFMKEHGTAAANVRCVNAYGPRQSAAPPFASAKVRKIMPAFICRALTGQPIEIYGDGEQVSDMVWVGDVARTLVRALECVDSFGKPIETTLEAGPKDSHTVNEIATKVNELTERLTGIEAQEIVHLPMRPGEVAGDKVTANPATLSLVGIDPNTLVTLDEGIEATIRWFMDNEGVTWKKP
jgi:UDP-glucose 4-epimerase